MHHLQAKHLIRSTRIWPGFLRSASYRSSDYPSTYPRGEGNNTQVASELEKLQNYYRARGEVNKAIAYAKILNTIKSIPYTIDSPEQLKNIKGLGPKSIEKVSEILQKGYLEATSQLEDYQTKALQKLERVHGIGPRKAKELFEKGIHNEATLKNYMEQHPSEFTHSQKASAEVLEDITQSVSAEELKTTAQSIEKLLKLVDPQAELKVGGAYRRGAGEAKELDLVVASEHPVNTLKLLVQQLKEQGMLAQAFTKAQRKFMGVIKHESFPHRRLDIFACKKEDLPFSLLYFSVSKDCNRVLRSEAKSRGLKLNPYGLYDKHGNKVFQPAREEDIVQYLGVSQKCLQPAGL